METPEKPEHKSDEFPLTPSTKKKEEYSPAFLKLFIKIAERRKFAL